MAFYELGRAPISPRKLIRYGKPKGRKEWNRPMPYYRTGAGGHEMARQLYRNIEPMFRPERHPFEKETHISFGDVGAEAQGQPSFWQQLVQTGTELFKTRETRKLTAEQAKIAQAEAEAKKAQAEERRLITTANWPLYLGIGGGALLLMLLLKRRKKR